LIEKIVQQRLLHRVGAYIAGLFILAFGVAVSINSDLGVSPVNSLPYVLSRIFGTEVGMWATTMFVILLIIQILILRKDFRWIDATQIIFSFIFGFFLDFTRWMLGDFQIPTYFGQFFMLVVSIILIAAGLTLIIGAKLVALPTEALNLAIVSKIKGAKFHNVKVIADCVLVLLAVIASLLFLGGLHGIREGTIISAVLIGKAIPFTRKALSPVFRLIYKGDGQAEF